jgi:pantoate--beta-alanine ligase
MKTISSITSLKKIIAAQRKKGKTIGFVPTMGAFHDGHLSLIKKCRQENDIVVVSIFVNPTQFGPKEDFSTYPRNKMRDCRLANEYGCDIVFYPSVATMYPEDRMTMIEVPNVSEGLCGAKRPGHFRGVATIVAKLFHIVTPDTAYFGQKDFQQVAVIRKMTADLNFPITIKTVPTFRETDGLAMSSRNVNLSANHRKEAAVLYQALTHAKDKIFAGEMHSSAIRSLIRSQINRTSGVIDYIECRDAKTLKPVKKFHGKCVIALAVFFGKVRLIDNIVLQI